MDRTSARRTKQRVTKRQSGPSATGWRNGLPEAFIAGQWVRWLVDGGATREARINTFEGNVLVCFDRDQKRRLVKISEVIAWQ